MCDFQMLQKSDCPMSGDEHWNPKSDPCHPNLPLTSSWREKMFNLTWIRTWTRTRPFQFTCCTPTLTDNCWCEKRKRRRQALVVSYLNFKQTDQLVTLVKFLSGQCPLPPPPVVVASRGSLKTSVYGLIWRTRHWATTPRLKDGYVIIDTEPPLRDYRMARHKVYHP